MGGGNRLKIRRKAEWLDSGMGGSDLKAQKKMTTAPMDPNTETTSHFPSFVIRFYFQLNTNFYLINQF